MKSNILSLVQVVFVMVLLVGCAAPAPAATATRDVPTSTSLPPTEAVPTSTSTPGIPGVQVSIPVGADGETLNATITGNGEVGIILVNSEEVPALRWGPLVESLGTNENLRIVTFDYRDVNSTGKNIEDVMAIHDYLRAEGIKKTICIGSGAGSLYCTNLQEEPEIIGMVLIATWAPAIDSEFPKLFLTADADPFGGAGSTKRAYEQSAEPKTFKSYAASVHGVSLFYKEDVGPQVLADVTDFINGIMNSQ